MKSSALLHCALGTILLPSSYAFLLLDVYQLRRGARPLLHFVATRTRRRRTPNADVFRRRASVGDNSQVDSAERRKGLAVLATVPLAWGSFEPACRYVYSIDPPIPTFLFGLAFYAVAATALSVAATVFVGKDEQPSTPELKIKSQIGGAELGLYLFIGNALQAWGLQTVASDRAAFLLQMTTLFVPMADALVARNFFKLSGRVWLACVIALLGVGIMSLDGQPDIDWAQMGDAVMSGFGAGDACIIAAAISYTFHCLRLEGYAKTTSAVQLAASKAWTETILSGCAVALFVAAASRADKPQSGDFLAETGRQIGEFSQSLVEGVATGSIPPETLAAAGVAVVWTGLVTCAYTIYAQTFGQRRVAPVTANLIYTAQPICTALIAWILLGERLGPAGYVGGITLMSAVYLVTTEDDA